MDSEAAHAPNAFWLKVRRKRKFGGAEQGARPMTPEANRQIVEAIFDELARGNGRPFTDAMADDFRWTIKG
jgi:hypothetical protein